MAGKPQEKMQGKEEKKMQGKRRNNKIDIN